MHDSIRQRGLRSTCWLGDSSCLHQWEKKNATGKCITRFCYTNYFLSSYIESQVVVSVTWIEAQKDIRGLFLCQRGCVSDLATLGPGYELMVISCISLSTSIIIFPASCKTTARQLYPTTLPTAKQQAASSKHQPPTTKQCCSLLECLLHFTLLFLFLLFMCFVYGALTYTQTKGQVSCYGCFFIISYVTDLDIHIDIHAHNEMKRM